MSRKGPTSGNTNKRSVSAVYLHAMKASVADVSYVKPAIFRCVCSYCDFYSRTMCCGANCPSFL